jgi:hypothetical protein
LFDKNYDDNDDDDEKILRKEEVIVAAAAAPWMWIIPSVSARGKKWGRRRKCKQ